jgi:hypothetical protein
MQPVFATPASNTNDYVSPVISQCQLWHNKLLLQLPCTSAELHVTAFRSNFRNYEYFRWGPGLIPCTTKKKSSGPGTGSTQPRKYNWGATWKKSSGSCLKNWEYGRREPSLWPRGTLYPHKIGNHFTDKRRSLDQYSSLTDSDRGVSFSF